MGKRLQRPESPVPEAARPAKKAAERAAAAEKSVWTAMTSPVKDSRDLMPIMVTLPKAHTRVLDTEASALGLRRSQLIELLLVGELGLHILQRPYVETYTFTRAELAQNERFSVYLRPELKKLLDDHIMRLGSKPSAWIAGALVKFADLGEALKAVR